MKGSIDASKVQGALEELWVDAHILATPVVIDIDADGALDAVVPVSYYYRHDRDGLDDPRIDAKNYVAGALVVIDIDNGRVKWSRTLEITTRRVFHPAYVLSQPLVVNVDSDGLMDVFITTAMREIRSAACCRTAALLLFIRHLMIPL